MTGSDRFRLPGPVPAVADLGRTHFIAIGGSGMSAVAQLFLERGLPVSGSDAKDSTVLQRLHAAGAEVHVGHDPGLVRDVDTVVVSSAIPESNPELAAARDAGTVILHRSQALAAAFGENERIAVAGANGKTTTSAMIAVALQSAGADPSFAIGAQVQPWGTGARVGAGRYAVIEADESDGSFLAYRPTIAVITSIQADHLDHYGTLDNVKAAYREFATTVDADGTIIACYDDAGALELASSLREQGRTVVTYGTHSSADIRLTQIRRAGVDDDSDRAAQAVLQWAGCDYPMSLQVPGMHNLLDAAAAFAACVVGAGANADAVLEGLAGFTGASRRFEIVGTVDGVTVVDDYAHNPAKVAAVVSTGAELAGRERVIVVFQPHLYSRTRDFAGEFADALGAASRVVLAPIYGAREEPIDGVNLDVIASPLRRDSRGVSVQVAQSLDEAAELVAAQMRTGDLVLVVGAGDVTDVGPRILQLGATT